MIVNADLRSCGDVNGRVAPDSVDACGGRVNGRVAPDFVGAPAARAGGRACGADQEQETGTSYRARLVPHFASVLAAVQAKPAAPVLRVAVAWSYINVEQLARVSRCCDALSRFFGSSREGRPSRKGGFLAVLEKQLLGPHIAGNEAILALLLGWSRRRVTRRSHRGGHSVPLGETRDRERRPSVVRERGRAPNDLLCCGLSALQRRPR